MTDKRKIEIIDMILDWFEKNPNDLNMFTGRTSGICHITMTEIGLTCYEATAFNCYLMSTTKRRWKYSNKTFKGQNYGEFIFKPGNMKPRINYLNKLKSKLS